MQVRIGQGRMQVYKYVCVLARMRVCKYVCVQACTHEESTACRPPVPPPPPPHSFAHSRRAAGRGPQALINRREYAPPEMAAGAAGAVFARGPLCQFDPLDAPFLEGGALTAARRARRAAPRWRSQSQDSGMSAITSAVSAIRRSASGSIVSDRPGPNPPMP